MRTSLGIAALLLCAAVPARAADPSTLNCVADSISDTVRADIAASARDLAAGGKAPPPEASKQALTDATQRCGERFGWSEAARTAARTYTLVHIGRVTVAPLAEAAGIKQGPFAEVLHALTADQRAKVLQREEATIDALVAAARAHGIPLNTHDQQHPLGVLATFTLYEEDLRADFAAA
jgi:hypothetical protein